MYIDIVPNRNSPPAVLLRESYRKGKRTLKRTLANLSMLPPAAIGALRSVLKGEELVNVDSILKITSSLPCGHVNAVKLAMQRLGMQELISSKNCPERKAVLAMIAQRILHPCSKLETVACMADSTLAQEFNVEGMDENFLYEAMDWLIGRQPFIERKLAARHLEEGAKVFYDVSSSSYYGSHCPLALRGYNRDGLKLKSIVYGLMTDYDGRPVAVRAYPGNTADPATVPDQVQKLIDDFSVSRFIIVGDRGMLTEAQINLLRAHSGCGWVSCLRMHDIRTLLEAQDPSDTPLFSVKNLAEITHPDYPGERLIACHNPFLGDDRGRTRIRLLAATEELLIKLQTAVARRTAKPMTASEIGLKAGRLINKYKVAKHYTLDIADNHFTWRRKEESIAREAALDGIYVIRTSETEQDLSAEDAVRAYKRLNNVERAFRIFKGVDLRIRPIYHHNEARVKAHVLLCMLAYYVEWHMRQALTPLLYATEELDIERAIRDPVAKAEPSASMKRKRSTKKTADGMPLRRWDGLLSSLQTIVRNSLTFGDGSAAIPLVRDTEPNEYQSRIFTLLAADAPHWPPKRVSSKRNGKSSDNLT